MTKQSFSFAPVFRQAQLQLGPAATNTTIGELLGEPRGTIDRWNSVTRPTGLSSKRAERVALRLGVAPVELWPDWYDTAGIGLVDARWVATEFGLSHSYVMVHVTRKPWFPRPVTGRRKRLEWEGHPKANAWDGDRVKVAMEANGYGLEPEGLTVKELAVRFGVGHSTVFQWANSYPCFPAPCHGGLPRRWDETEVWDWWNVTAEASSLKFGRRWEAA